MITCYNDTVHGCTLHCKGWGTACQLIIVGVADFGQSAIAVLCACVCVCVYTVCVQLMEQWHVLKTIHRYIVAGAY